MRYGYFDNKNREYVIDRIDVPVSWTNYIGVNRMCAVLSHVAGGYSFYRDAEHGRITRFRPNSVPMDWPGHWIYLRDDEDGDYWTVTWQPVGKPLDQAKYECRHGLSYSRYKAEYKGIRAEQLIFITREDDVEIWDVRVKNLSNRPCALSLFSYLEWSFHHIEIDNQNFQMSLYASGADYDQGVIVYDFHYEPSTYHFHAASFEPDSFDTTRDSWIGPYRSERNPMAVNAGRCSGSAELTGNHCASLHKRITLAPGEEQRFVFMIGYGDRAVGIEKKAKYSDFKNVDAAFADLKDYWDEKCAVFQATTPNPGLDTMVNIWTLYQAETCVVWSRFASFIEVGGRTGLGYRDTSQDVMAVPHINPAKVKQRLKELLNGQVSLGYGLHLFDPEWFRPQQKPKFKSPTIAHAPAKSNYIHGPNQACSDDHLWLIPSICDYVKETGDTGFFDEVVPYCNESKATVWDHMRAGLDFSAKYVGPSGICLGLRADWNDCLNLGGGESAMVSFLHHWALNAFVEAAEFLGRHEDAETYRTLATKVRIACEREMWDGKWYARGTTASGLKIGTDASEEAKVFIESNSWAVVSDAAPREHAERAVAAMDEHLFSPWGLHLLQPSFSRPNDEIGFMGRVYKGIKENGAIFSHPNPWAVIAAAKLGQGDRAMRFYDSLLPYNQNDKIEIRQAEPYSYCQFVYGAEHERHGRARHPWLTGSAGWNYTAVTKWILGVRPGFRGLVVDPCIPSDWPSFTILRKWRGATYRIEVRNPDGVSKGVRSILLDGNPVVGEIPNQPAGSVNEVTIILG
jgi:N,N'-diacetylchitobiose phosphorylase